MIQTGFFGCLKSNTKSNAKVFLLFSTKPGELHPTQQQEQGFPPVFQACVSNTMS